MSRHRAAAILIEDDALALIERHRADRHYFVLPGGGIEEGESAERAVVREVDEELGLRVRVLCQVACIRFRGRRQDYFLVERTGGEFGSGTGPEFSGLDPEHGTYHPVRVPLGELKGKPLLPRSMIAFILRNHREGWPAEPVIWAEEERD